MRENIVVVGAGYAGMLASLRLAKRLRHREVEITLVNASPFFVERIRNHELAAGTPPPARPIARMLRGTGVRFVEARVTAIEPVRQVVAAGGRQFSYDRLVYALGSTASAEIPGAREHACLIGDEAGARKLRAALDGGARKIAVVGGGLTGIEIATEMAERGLEVTLVSSGLGEFLSSTAREYLRRTFARLNLRVVEKAVREVRADHLVLDGDESLPIQACAWAGGFAAPPLARASGLAVDEDGRLLVDGTLRSISHPSVYGAGDAAAITVEVGAPMRAGCKYAMPMAAHAADNLARELEGSHARPFRYGDTVFCLSLGRRDGLIQICSLDGKPLEKIITGRRGVWIKELICRFTVWSLRLERWFAFYTWRRPRALESHNAPKRLAA